MQHKGLWLCLGVYFVLCLTTFALWQHKGINQLTGDEPHYLIISDSLIHDHSLELSAAYHREFINHRLYAPGLAAPDAQPDASNTHGVQGPHGLYSVHNIGLPLLLAIPYALGGPLASKLFLLLLSSWAVVLAWKLARHSGLDPRLSTLATLTLTAAMPLIPAATQVYPDLLAGLICLNTLYWIASADRLRRLPTTLAYAAVLALLPWLQIKFSAAALILMASATWLGLRHRLGTLQTLVWPLLLGASLILLASYNQYAFDKFSGPYQSGALELSETAAMVTLGLLVDQNQGMLLQNPLLLLGVLFLLPLLRDRPVLALTGVLVFLSLWIPNGLHPNWYGGGSFSGRFGWAAALCLFVPTLAAIGPLMTVVGRRCLTLLLMALALLQAAFFVKYAWAGADLYNRAAGQWLSTYSMLYGRLHNALPALYDIDWASTFAPNYLFALLLPGLVLYGAYLFPSSGTSRRLTPRWVLPPLAGVMLVVGLATHPQEKPLHFSAASLPSLTGQLDARGRQATPGHDAAGFLSFGPYISLSRGHYRLRIDYQADGPASEDVATWDIYRPHSASAAEQATALTGSNGHPTSRVMDFRIASSRSEPYEFRVAWSGTQGIRLIGMSLEHLD